MFLRAKVNSGLYRIYFILYDLCLSFKLEDTLWSGLTDAYTGTPMAITAENLAEKYGVTRLDCDEYALQSQQRWENGM